MEIKDIKTVPPTITREVAAAKIKGGHITTIDRAITGDKIDYCLIGRSKMVVVNKKWDKFLKAKNIEQ